MNILKLFTKEKRKVSRVKLDTVQESLNRIGREQFVKLMEKGLKIPVVLV